MFRNDRANHNTANYYHFHNENLDYYSTKNHYHNGIDTTSDYYINYSSNNYSNGDARTWRRNRNYCVVSFLISDLICYNTASLSLEKFEKKASIEKN